MSSKQAIGKKFKNIIWNYYFPNDISGKCLSCKIDIDKNSYSAGHIIAEKIGGIVSECNIVPICKDCNNKCGQKNLIEFAKNKYNVDIIPHKDYYNYKKNIDDGNDFYYNTTKCMSDENIKKYVEMIIKYINENNLIIQTEKDLEHRIWQFDDIMVGNVTFNKLFIKNWIFSVIKEHECNKYQLFFLVKENKTYKIYIQVETYEFPYKRLNKQKEFKDIKLSDFIIPKNLHLTYKMNLIHDIIKIDDKVYLQINNNIYNYKSTSKRDYFYELNKITNDYKNIETIEEIGTLKSYFRKPGTKIGELINNQVVLY